MDKTGIHVLKSNDESLQVLRDISFDVALVCGTDNAPVGRKEWSDLATAPRLSLLVFWVAMMLVS